MYIYSLMICVQHSLHLLSSSLLSPQSSAPSHTQRLGMQRWFPHSNWVAEQNLSRGPERMYKELNTSAKTVCCNLACLGLWYLNLPQLASSAPFSQSFSLSQVQLKGIQRPLGHVKKCVGHLVFLLPTSDRELASQRRKYIRIGARMRRKTGNTFEHCNDF